MPLAWDYSFGPNQRLLYQNYKKLLNQNLKNIQSKRLPYNSVGKYKRRESEC